MAKTILLGTVENHENTKPCFLSFSSFAVFSKFFHNCHVLPCTFGFLGVLHNLNRKLILILLLMGKLRLLSLLITFTRQGLLT